MLNYPKALNEINRYRSFDSNLELPPYYIGITWSHSVCKALLFKFYSDVQNFLNDTRLSALDNSNVFTLKDCITFYYDSAEYLLKHVTNREFYVVLSRMKSAINGVYDNLIRFNIEEFKPDDLEIFLYEQAAKNKELIQQR